MTWVGLGGKTELSVVKLHVEALVDIQVDF